MDIGDFRTSHALINPAHHITQDTLSVVVQLLLNLGCTPVWFDGYGDLKDLTEQTINFCWGIYFFKCSLYVCNTDLMVVQGMQRRGSWGGNPCRIRTSFGVCDFLFEHRRHQVWHGPHAFADLCATAQAASQACQDVAAFVSRQPGA